MAGRALLKWTGIATVVVVAGITAYVVHWLKNENLLMLQACAEVERPVVGWVCEQGLYRFHPTAAEVAELNTVAGALFPVDQAKEERARRLLRHYLAAGLDINAADQRIRTKWTALHVMAVEPNPLAVRILLEHGARTDVRDADGRTPADLARLRQAKSQGKASETGYQEVISLLDKAQAGSQP